MKNLFHAGKFLLLDMASTIFFLILYMLTKNIGLAMGLGLAAGLGEIVWRMARKQPVDTMQWMSLFLVVASGAAALLTKDARFILIKPSLIYVVVGVVMLKRGWMNRYLPEVAMRVVPDIAVAFGYVWAGLMFASAALSLVLALNTDMMTWTKDMTAWGLTTKLGLFLIQYTTMRLIGLHRRRGQVVLAAA